MRPHLLLLALLLSAAACLAQDDIADVPAEKLQIGKDANKTYFLIPPAAKKPPKAGFGLLVILPGGDGGAGFHPFLKRIRKHAVADDVIVAQPVAVKWTPTQQIVWPTAKLPAPKQEFTTEQFVAAVIKDVQARHKVDPSRVHAMAWSSSGSAAYAMALSKDSSIRGAYILMSVYQPKLLPPIAGAKGKSIYLEHSPQDRICPFWMARKAHADLTRAGVRATLATYTGGHGWRGAVFPRIKKALAWLTAAPAAKEGD